MFYWMLHLFPPGAEIAYWLRMQVDPRLTLASGTFFFQGEFSPSSAESRRASCQSLTKEWALSTGILPQEACQVTVWLSN